MSAAVRTDRWQARQRQIGLRTFASAFATLTLLGHTWLGFELAWIQPLVGEVTACSLELLLETLEARREGRRARYRGGPGAAIDFLLSPFISGTAVGMLLYPGGRMLPVALAAALAIASKHLLRVRIGERTRHALNPSNFGITLTLLLFPWVGIAAPYMFTENLGPVGDWVFPAVVIVAGSLLNARFTHRIPLILAWLSGFVLQGLLRHFLLGNPFAATLMPVSGLAFLLFTFYMVTDPPTTPHRARGQILFGLSVAAVYGLLMVAHIVFGLFFSLTIVCAVRFLFLRGREFFAAPRPRPAPSPAS